MILKSTIFYAQAGSGLVGDEDSFGAGSTLSTRVESSYIINLRELDMKHVKDFVFVHGVWSSTVRFCHRALSFWIGKFDEHIS